MTSRMAVMVNPVACSARKADSRPEPGPRTWTSSVRTPCSCAIRPALSAAICAAYGVDFRDPLNPCCPAEDHAIALPCASVMVTIVLLNVAETWATPEVIFLRSRLRTRAVEASRAISKLPFSYQILAAPDPCGCARWCACADHARAIRDDGAGRGSNRDP